MNKSEKLIVFVLGVILAGWVWHSVSEQKKVAEVQAQQAAKAKNTEVVKDLKDHTDLKDSKDDKGIKDLKDPQDLKAEQPVAPRAPEQLVVQATLDRRTDLYCLAAAGYCALTGQYPRSAAERLRGQPLVPPSVMVPGLPAFFGEILTRGLSIPKTDRFQSGAQMIEEIDRHMSFTVSGTGAGLAAVSAKLLQEKRSPLGVLISRLRR